MRGQTVFNRIIKDGGLTGTLRKGRNDTLITKRNECLTARYFFYGSSKNKCYEEILRMLVGEFYLSPATISAIIMDRTEQLQMLKQKQPTLFYFQNRWPHLKW